MHDYVDDGRAEHYFYARLLTPVAARRGLADRAAACATTTARAQLAWITASGISPKAPIPNDIG